MNIRSTFSILIIPFFIVLTIPTLEAQSWNNWYKISNSIDLVFGTDFGFRLIEQKDGSSAAAQEYQNRSEFETYKANLRFGLNYLHGISQRLSIKTGIRLANPGFTILGVEDIDPNQDINTIDKELNRNLEGSDFKYNYHFIEIPLGLRYTLTKNTCEPYFELGVATNLYRRTRISRKKFNQNGSASALVQEGSINKINYVGFFSLGGNINFTQNISGFTQLVARYQLNNLRDSAIIERMVGLGLEVGVRRYIN